MTTEKTDRQNVGRSSRGEEGMSYVILAHECPVGGGWVGEMDGSS